MRQLWLVLSLALALEGCDAPPQTRSLLRAAGCLPDVVGCALQGSSKPECRKSDVRQLREPDRITMETCGQQTGKPWQCKVHHYGICRCSSETVRMDGS